ncbi:MAG: 30S ribosomal protein S7 [Anaerolineales bacterium]|nr:30S ribosomal protein S7 [Anaerolineales bacterium]
MPRRYRPEKRPVEPDLRHNSVYVSMFVNRLMRDGKKSVALSVLYKSFDLIEDRTNRSSIEVFEQALNNVRPQVEVRPRRVGGATYQVPMEVRAERKLALALRWIISAARARGGRTTQQKIADELMDAAQGRGSAVKKREDTHRMAEANRAFSHFRW